MKCRKCGHKAIINMRQHKLALCKEHFLEWIPTQTDRVIRKYGMFSHQDRILLAVSGGKDSLSLWDVLWRLNYRVDGLYIGLGINGSSGYSDESQRLARIFAEERGLELRIFDVVQVYGESIPGLARRTNRGKGKPCAVCGLTKRHVMNKVALENGYDVLATGHNLDDETATLFGNTLNWTVRYLKRQSPVMESTHPGLVRKVKPFCRLYERETAAYAFARSIEYVYDECPYSAGAKSIYYKDLFNRLEADRPGAKLSFYLTFLKAKEEYLFAVPDEEQTDTLNTCSTCGGPTTVPGECAFCRMVIKVRP